MILCKFNEIYFLGVYGSQKCNLHIYFFFCFLTVKLLILFEPMKYLRSLRVCSIFKNRKKAYDAFFKFTLFLIV